MLLWSLSLEWRLTPQTSKIPKAARPSDCYGLSAFPRVHVLEVWFSQGDVGGGGTVKS
jgi:hypothetical protein